MKSREFYIAGVQFHEIDQCINDLEVGMELHLWPDPDNKYDPNAVEIRHVKKGDSTYEPTVMIGFVPKKFAGEVAAAHSIDSNKLTCKITELTPSAKPWERIKVIIEGGEDA